MVGVRPTALRAGCGQGASIQLATLGSGASILLIDLFGEFPDDTLRSLIPGCWRGNTMVGTLVRPLMLCVGLAMVAPSVVAQDECGEDECEDSAGSAAQEDASDWSDDADSEGALEQEDDPGCAEGACDTGDEPSDQDDGLDPDSEDSGAAASEEEEEEDSGADGATPTADVPSPAAAEKPSAPAPTPAPEAVTSAQGAVSEVTDDSLPTLLLESNGPVLVFFWAEWCGPCRMVLPALNELAGDYAGRARIVSINIDENPDFVNKFGVRNVPLFLLFKGGAMVDKHGAATKSDLASLIDRNL
jgi:thioredoxin 1